MAERKIIKDGKDKELTKEEAQKQFSKDYDEYFNNLAKSAWFRASTGNRVVTRNLNGQYTSPTFSVYTKDDIQNYIADPNRYEEQLRDAVIYIYGASSHFRRLIQYFVGLTDLSYVVTPTGFEPNKAKPETVERSYRKVLKLLDAFNIRGQIPNILTTCLREDIYYGTMWVTDSSIILQQLNSKYCKLAVIEDNVFNVMFDFSFFDTNAEMLEYFPQEFSSKYRQYQSDMTNKWIELDSPTSFAVKCNTDVMDYAMPPFAGVLRELYDLEDYKGLKLTKTALENYAMLIMHLPIDKDGNYLLNLQSAKNFWGNLDSITPEEIGSVLSPMEIEKISFEKSNTGDTDTIAQCEQNLFTSAGVSSLLFNNEKASANALSLSIKVDQSITFGIVKSVEGVLNRFLKHDSNGSKYKLTFLDVSPFNRKEMGDQYLKAAQYGLPTVMMFAASQGLSQSEVDCMSFLENDVLGLKEKLVPLQSSATQSANSSSESEGEAGAPQKDVGELTDSGEENREDGDDW